MGSSRSASGRRSSSASSTGPAGARCSSRSSARDDAARRGRCGGERGASARHRPGGGRRGPRPALGMRAADARDLRRRRLPPGLARCRRPAGLRGGKSVRGALALCSARAAGADAAAGIPGAVAVELVHTFSLLHDDIMDGDRERHGRPAAWTTFGRARAILAGDAALALAYRVLLDADPPAGGAALESLAEATERLIDGQALDLDLEGRAGATPEDCIRMCAGKTGALLGC